MGKSHQPTPEQRAQVEALAGYGIREDEIARYIGVAPKTLRRHYDNELKLGTTKANVQVARQLHQKAMEGNVSASIFWLKARAGWREKHEISGPEGGEVPVSLKVEFVKPTNGDESDDGE